MKFDNNITMNASMITYLKNVISEFPEGITLKSGNSSGRKKGGRTAGGRAGSGVSPHSSSTPVHGNVSQMRHTHIGQHLNHKS